MLAAQFTINRLSFAALYIVVQTKTTATADTVCIAMLDFRTALITDQLIDCHKSYLLAALNLSWTVPLEISLSSLHQAPFADREPFWQGAWV
jgi:hypothetical protein